MSPPLILVYAAVAASLVVWGFRLALRQLDIGVTRWPDGEGPVHYAILWQSAAAALLGGAGFWIGMAVTARGELIPMIAFVGYGTATLMAALNVFTFRLNHQDLVISRSHRRRR